MHIYMIKKERNLSHAEKNFLIQLCDKKKYEKINLLKKIEDFEASLIGHVLIKYMISQYTLFNMRNIILTEGTFGKPIYSESNISFNISHSNSIITGAIDNQDIGIDIEYMEEIDYIGISNLIFSESEKNSLISSTKPKDYFYHLWTAKESYLKAIGTGLFLEMCNVTLEESNIKEKNEATLYYCHHLGVIPKYKLCVCTKKKNINEIVIEMNIQDFIQSLLIENRGWCL